MQDASNKAPALEDTLGRLRGPLHRYLRRYVGDEHVAEDLLQETFLKIANNRSELRQDSSLPAWAFRIATHTAIDYLRKLGRDTTTVPFDDSEPPSGDFDLAGDRIVIREMNSCIREEIDRLPVDYRAAILLHDLEGLTAADTALAMDCSIATAKIRIHRARLRLRKILERDCSFYYDRDQTLRCDRRPSEGTH